MSNIELDKNISILDSTGITRTLYHPLLSVEVMVVIAMKYGMLPYEKE